MKKYFISAMLLVLCIAMVMSSCGKNAVKSPENLKKELEEMGATVFVYSSSDTAKYKSMANLFGLDESKMSGVTNILIAEAGDGSADPRPLIIFYCSSVNATNTVFDSAKGSLNEIAKFIGFNSADECNLMKLDNTVMVGHMDMINMARSYFG